MNYRIVSFGTHGKTYRRGLNKIRAQCKNLDIPNYLWQIDSVTFRRPGWYGAVLYKPTFIREMLHGFNETIVWMDGDCQVLDRFELPDGDWDIGLVPHQLAKNRILFTPWIVSFLAIRPTRASKWLLELWQEFCKQPGRESDHERLMYVLTIMEDNIKVKNILSFIRGKIYLDPRHRKRSKLTYEEMPAVLDDWYPLTKEET